MIESKIISYRKRINNLLKKNGCKYDYSATITNTYIGDAFYINHRQRVTELNRIYGYDKHWAYGGTLKYKVFPKSSVLGDKKTELGIHLIFFTGYKKRYKDFYYTLYEHNMIKVKQGFMIYLTNLDVEIFKDLYILENMEIASTLYFQDVGKLGLDDLIDEAYKDKKTCSIDEKFIYEAAFYGLFAKKLWEYETPWGRRVYLKALHSTGCEKIRHEQTPIALWQTAYLRYEEWKLFKKHMDKVVYMNTDSIYCVEDFYIEEDKGLGCYGKCYNGEYIQFIRRNAYVVFNDDMSINDIIIGGVAKELNAPYITPETLKKLREGESIKCKSYEDDKKKKIVYIQLHPDFINYFQGECKNPKYLL